MTSANNVIEEICIKDAEKHAKVPSESVPTLRSFLRKFIEHKMTYQEAKDGLTAADIDCAPLNLAKKYLSTEDDPIPPKTKMHENCRHTSKKKQLNPWSDYEDKRLTMGVHKYGLSDWDSVAAFVGNNRTRAQCSQRWERTLDPSISKDPWTPEEEEILENAVQKFGNKSWTKVAQQLGSRTDVQCRYHYKYVLKGSSPKALKLQEMKKDTKKCEQEPAEKDFLSFLDKAFFQQDLLYNTSAFEEEWLIF